MSNLLKEKCSLTKLREKGEESYVNVAKGLGTWPETAGTEKKKKRGQLFLKINLKY